MSTAASATSGAAPPGKEARQVAAAILEVLAGARTPQEAARALGWSVVRYYQVEGRALRGLVAACAPAPRGRQPSAETELGRLRREQARLQRELTRQQALVRVVQRQVGLPPVAAKPAGKKQRRRRTARALTVAERLRQPEAAAPAPAPPSS
jgi:hypothetical protein